MDFTSNKQTICSKNKKRLHINWETDLQKKKVILISVYMHIYILKNQHCTVNLLSNHIRSLWNHKIYIYIHICRKSKIGSTFNNIWNNHSSLVVFVTESPELYLGPFSQLIVISSLPIFIVVKARGENNHFTWIHLTSLSCIIEKQDLKLINVF